MTDYELQSTSYPPENLNPLYGLVGTNLPGQQIIWLRRVLAMEIPPARWPATDRQRGERSDPNNEY
jgi:hypothetical protein